MHFLVALCVNVCYIINTITTKHEGNMQNVLQNLTEKEINTLTHTLMERAFTQMEQSDNLQNADKVAEHMEDYYTYFVK